MTDTPKPDFQALFESLPHAYIAFRADDPKFTIVAENAAHARMTNIDGKTAIGRGLFEVFPDVTDRYKTTGVSELAESLRKVIKTGKPDAMPVLHYDIPGKKGDFEERFWRVTHYPVFDTAGKVSTIYQTAEDITQDIQAQDRLHRAERQLHEALSSGLIGTWVWDIEDQVIVGDKYMADMFGVPEHEAATGMTADAFNAAIHPDDSDRIMKAFQVTIKSKKPLSIEYRIRRADGSTRWVLSRGRLEKDGDGNVVALTGALIDITDRKLIETNLSFLAEAGTVLAASLDYRKTLQSIARLAVPQIADWCTVDMFDDSGALQTVAVAHKDPKKVAWAREFREQQGPTDLTTNTGMARVLRTGETEFYPIITDEMLKATAQSKKELELLRSIGFSSVIIVPIIVDDRPVGGISLISSEQKRHYNKTDLQMAQELARRASIAMTNARLYHDAQTELAARRRLEEQLRVANEELEHRVIERTAQLESTNINLQRSNQELQDFAYVASHDLQEPLRKIQAFGNLLEEEYADKLGGGKDYLERMRGAAARMSALIEDILSFSRVTTKARGFEPVDLAVVTGEVIDDLETRIEDTKATVEVGKLPTIDADPMQMRQLLQNLIANALKFHKPDQAPLVKVRAATEISQESGTKYCRLEVEDNGVGFDEKYLDRIFAVFQRLHSRESFEGTGIGLAVCRKIVERHGGTITARSKPGVGATFIIHLPMHHKKGDTL